jgi:putative transposase
VKRSNRKGFEHFIFRYIVRFVYAHLLKFLGGNWVKIGSRIYQYWNSREIEGKIKTLTIKRTPLGELFMVVVVDGSEKEEIKFTTSKIAGFDFGLKAFLTCSDGSKIESPQFFTSSLNAIRIANRHHSKKLKGSSNRERARKNLVRLGHQWLG